MLEKIKKPEEIKSMSYGELSDLSCEIRQKMIDTVSKTGGHLGSNLGTVELTLALHRVFNSPYDSIIFDVGHQSYTHKLLTGRYDKFNTLRQKDGISGFLNRQENIHDVIGTGHSGTSVSVALGIAQANKLDNNDNFAVAVVGDGSLTNGMIYEALNNCTGKNLNLCVVINDNEMSISKNVGAISNYLSDVTSSKTYINFKNRVYSFCMKLGKFGDVLYRISKSFKDFFKRIMIQKNFFECLGFKYYGPIDGHDLPLLESVLLQAKRKKTPTIIHVFTKKGKGYTPAENSPENYHSVSPFNKDTGIVKSEKEDFSSVFGRLLTEEADKDKRICAVTAAMEQGTGLCGFSKKHSDRFFDVGIAEEHAVTFCAGLSLKNKIPVFAVYSSFIQRDYDQLIHDISIQNIKCIFAIDRAGIVPGDGITHQGIYDVSLIKAINGFEIYSPETYGELKNCLDSALSSDKPTVIRYSKGSEATYDRSKFENKGEFSVCTYGNEKKPKISLVTYGIITDEVNKTALALSENYFVTLVKLIKISPINYGEILPVLTPSSLVLFAEEGIENGGVGEETGLQLQKSGYKGKYLLHTLSQTGTFKGDRLSILKEQGFTSDSLMSLIKEHTPADKQTKP